MTHVENSSLARRHPKPIPPRPPLPLLTRIVDGVEYVVTWHGGMDGAAALGMPLAHERGQKGYGDHPGGHRGAGGRVTRHVGSSDGGW
jgi:hypothetical protein